MENFREKQRKQRSFLDTLLNNLINERCKETNTVLDHRTELRESITNYIVRDACYICDERITRQLLKKKSLKKNLKMKRLEKIIYAKSNYFSWNIT